jgi:hypothetical protein
MFFILSFLFFILQNWRSGGQNKSTEGVSQHQWERGGFGEKWQDSECGAKNVHTYK